MDKDLPFYLWTLNERYRGFNEDLPLFDCCSEIPATIAHEKHPLRLHRLKINRREDSSIFAPSRSFLPRRNKTTIRQRVHRPEGTLPPNPENLQK